MSLDCWINTQYSIQILEENKNDLEEELRLLKTTDSQKSSERIKVLQININNLNFAIKELSIAFTTKTFWNQ